jgi:hypothetical protein
MKKLITIILWISASFAYAGNDVPCPYNSDGTIDITAAINSGEQACAVRAASYNFDVYGFGLCQAALVPSTTNSLDFSKCVQLRGNKLKRIRLSTSAIIPMDDIESPIVGTYRYIYLIVGNSFSMEAEVKLDSSTGTTFSGKNESSPPASRATTFCSTNGSNELDALNGRTVIQNSSGDWVAKRFFATDPSVPALRTATCGSQRVPVIANKQTIVTFTQNDGITPTNQTSFLLEGLTVTYFLLSEDLKLISMPNSVPDIVTANSLGVKKILGLFPLNQDITIKEDTKLNFKLNLSEGARWSYGDNAPNYTVENLHAGNGFIFHVETRD